MKVVPTYGRFKLRPTTVTTLDGQLKFPDAFTRFRSVITRCGYRYWFPETSEAAPPPDPAEWWNAFRAELLTVEAAAQGAALNAGPLEQLTLYHAAVVQAFSTHLGMEESWELKLTGSKGRPNIRFMGIIERPYCDATTAYCEIALELQVFQNGGARLRYTPPTWIDAHPLELCYGTWPEITGVNDALIWELPNAGPHRKWVHDTSRDPVTLPSSGDRAAGDRQLDEKPTGDNKARKKRKNRKRIPVKVPDLETLLGHGDRTADDRSGSARQARVKQMTYINPDFADIRIPGA